MKSWCLTPRERRSVSLIHLDMPAIFHSVSSRAAQHESQIKFNYPASVRINSRVENMTGERASHVIGDGLRIQPQVNESRQRWTKELIMPKKKKVLYRGKKNKKKMWEVFACAISLYIFLFSDFILILVILLCFLSFLLIFKYLHVINCIFILAGCKSRIARVGCKWKETSTVGYVKGFHVAFPPLQV